MIGHLKGKKQPASESRLNQAGDAGSKVLRQEESAGDCVCMLGVSWSGLWAEGYLKPTEKCRKGTAIPDFFSLNVSIGTPLNFSY
jgi:hypothetical protein